VILVDSSVWIDFFRNEPTVQAEWLDRNLGIETLVVGDLILAEVLRGFKDDRGFNEARRLLAALEQLNRRRSDRRRSDLSCFGEELPKAAGRGRHGAGRSRRDHRDSLHCGWAPPLAQRPRLRCIRGASWSAGGELWGLDAAHEAAFAHFGGRCEFLLYDRMRTVVLGTSGGKPRLNPTFAAFAAHWGFTPRLCQPYRAQTKGKVESGVKYVKRNFVPGRVFRDLEDFNEQLADWQADVADLREHGTTHERPIDRFADEARALAPTAGHASFLQAMVRDRVVADDWLVSIDGNRYSVPFTLIGKTVQVVREGGSWVVRHRGVVVAEHAVLGGRGQLSVRPEHGPGAAARNARQRYAAPRPAAAAEPQREVEVRDLAIYERLFGAEPVEATA
jgi:predicted nucleic acid-binding protein